MMNLEAVNRLRLTEVSEFEKQINIHWMMAANNVNTDTLKYRNHSHNFYEAHFVLSGHMTYGFDNKTVTVKKDEYLLVSPMTPHRVDAHSDDFIKFTVAFEASGSTRRVFTDAQLNPTAMSDEMKLELEHVFDRASDVKGYSSEVVSAGLLKLLLLIAESKSKYQPKNAKKEYDGRVIKVKRLIEDNPNIFFTASELADYCGISSKQLGRLFRRYERTGVLEYIHQKKIELAKMMITESGATLEDVSRSLGFSDGSYFSKFFLKNVGVTPGEYRKGNL